MKNFKHEYIEGLEGDERMAEGVEYCAPKDPEGRCNGYGCVRTYPHTGRHIAHTSPTTAAATWESGEPEEGDTPVEGTKNRNTIKRIPESDLPEEERLVLDNEPPCMAKAPNVDIVLSCTRSEGHTGRHVAHGVNGDALAIWED